MASTQEVRFIEEDPGKNRRRKKKGYYLLAVDLEDPESEYEPWKMDIVIDLITEEANVGLKIVGETDLTEDWEYFFALVRVKV